MQSVRPLAPKCLFAAWVVGWATAVYVPSLSIALLSLSPLATGTNLFLDTFQVADEVSPAAKLAFAVLFGSFLVGMRMAGAKRRLLIDALVGVISVIIVVAFLPEDWSRGFGIGLARVRFDTVLTTIYVIGGFLGGVVFSLSEARCVLHNQKQAIHQPAKD